MPTTSRIAALACLLLGCAAPAAPPRVVHHYVTVPRAQAEEPQAAPPPALSPAEHWYFEHMSPNGRHALLRRLDPTGRSTMQTRIVDVDSGAILEEVTMPELAKFPATTIGRTAKDVAKLDALLAAPAFGEDLVRAAHVAGAFPFGSCGRLAAGSGAIAFNAGDWLYVADAKGSVKKKLAQEAAYDPRFSPDGKFLFFRRATGSIDRVFAKYELFVMPADMSQAARPLSGTAGARDAFTPSSDGQSALVVASHEPQIKTCVLSIGTKAPFVVKKVGCLEGGEVLVESALSPRGRFAALTTQAQTKEEDGGEAGPKSKRAMGHVDPTWRLRVINLATGLVVHDVAAEAGFSLRAVSDAGLVVQSGIRGVMLDDAAAKTHRLLEAPVDLGHRGFFRSATELVVLRGSGVAVVDLKDAR